MTGTAWPLVMFPLTRTSRHLKLLLKYIKINENACVGVAKFGTITQTERDLLNVCGRYRVADIDLWPISSSMWPIWFVADIDVIRGADPGSRSGFIKEPKFWLVFKSKNSEIEFFGMAFSLIMLRLLIS